MVLCGTGCEGEEMADGCVGLSFVRVAGEQGILQTEAFFDVVRAGP